MVRYSTEPENPAQSCLTRGSYLRVHFKKCREVGAAIKGMELARARAYLEDVLEQKRGVPMRRFTGGCGRHAVGKLENAPGNCVAFPVKAVGFFLDMLTNLQSNAEAKGLNVDDLAISHVQVNQAPKTRRRTYRAHGRITAYKAHPCHIEMIATVNNEPVAKPEGGKQVKLTRKQLARMRIKAGGGN